ncbi:MAG: LIC_13387 family protein [Burkholderiales bacterium]
MADGRSSWARRLFLATAWGLIVVAVLHTVGNFDIITGASNNPKTQPAVVAMAAVVFEGMGMRFSLIDIFRSLNASFGWLLAMAGMLDVVGLRLATDQGRAIRALGGVSMVGIGALVIMFAWLQIPPPLVTLVVVWVLFGLAVAANARFSGSRG